MDMVPCYQICKDVNCSHFDIECFECDRLLDDCEHATAHLVSDRENQKLDENWHGRRVLTFSDGRPSGEGYYICGRREGRFRYWYESGGLMESGYFVNDERGGKWRFWYSDGRLKNEGFYVEGKRHGFWRFWYKNGQLRSEGNYEESVKVGRWSYWYEDGQLMY